MTIERLVLDRHDWWPEPPEGSRHLLAPEPPKGARIVHHDVRLIDRTTREVVAVQLTATGAMRQRMAWLGRVVSGDRGFPWMGGPGSGHEFRLSGFKNAHVTFGHSSPVPLRRRYGCSVCSFNRERPGVATTLCDQLSVDLWRRFRRHAPKQAAEHYSLVSAIHSDWWLGVKHDVPWTSGILNDTAALPYHRDSGNVRGAWSAMIAVRTDGPGGYLHLPEYDVWLASPSYSLTFFNGQAVWHGVTPLTLDTPKAHRYTMVWYAKQGMLACGPADDEPSRAAKYRTRLDDQTATLS